MSESDGQTSKIREAEWPADQAVAVALLRDYAAHLASNPKGTVHICLIGYEEELASAGKIWSAPNGALLLAFLGAAPAGCVAIKVRHDRPGTCEMKRLWVAPPARRHRLGRRLAEAAIAWSRTYGAATLLLDTVPEAMPEAVALYRSLGFEETTRHNDNPVPGLQFMRLRLR